MYGRGSQGELWSLPSVTEEFWQRGNPPKPISHIHRYTHTSTRRKKKKTSPLALMLLLNMERCKDTLSAFQLTWNVDDLTSCYLHWVLICFWPELSLSVRSWCTVTVLIYISIYSKLERKLTLIREPWQLLCYIFVQTKKLLNVDDVFILDCHFTINKCGKRFQPYLESHGKTRQRTFSGPFLDFWGPFAESSVGVSGFVKLLCSGRDFRSLQQTICSEGSLWLGVQQARYANPKSSNSFWAQ